MASYESYRSQSFSADANTPNTLFSMMVVILILVVLLFLTLIFFVFAPVNNIQNTVIATSEQLLQNSNSVEAMATDVQDTVNGIKTTLIPLAYKTAADAETVANEVKTKVIPLAFKTAGDVEKTLATVNNRASEFQIAYDDFKEVVCKYDPSLQICNKPNPFMPIGLSQNTTVSQPNGLQTNLYQPQTMFNQPTMPQQSGLQTMFNQPTVSQQSGLQTNLYQPSVSQPTMPQQSTFQPQTTMFSQPQTQFYQPPNLTSGQYTNYNIPQC